MKRKRKKWLILFLCAILTLALSACGKKESDNGSSESETQDTPSLVYEPEYFEPELEEGEGVFWNDAFLAGDELFFHAIVFDEEEQAPRVLLRRTSLTKGNTRETVLQLTAETVLNSWSMDDNGDIYALLSVWNSSGETEEESFTTKLVRYDSWGNEVYAQDITDILAGENSGNTGIAVDGQGRVFLICNGGILLFDETGKSCGSIDMSTGVGSLVNGFCRGIDGKVYISATVNSSTDRKATLYEADFGAAKLGNGRADFPVGLGRILSQDADGNFLLYDQSAVFRYDPKDGQTNKLFDWLDINLTGTEVCAAGGLSDGRIALVYQDRNGSGGRVALLPETGAAVTHKQKLVLGTLTTNYILQDLVVNFNKSSDAWQVTVKAYLDDDSQSDAFKADALVRLNSDIASGNGPDLFLFSASSLYDRFRVDIPEDDLDVKMLADKNVFEDLTPYLERSAVLNREDMYDSVLDAYTFDGVLVSIPKKFVLSTYFGGAKQLGDRGGWTLDEMMDCYKAHPDRELFYEPTSMSVMNFCLMFNLDSFVDWEKGTCHFDSQEFKSLLEFAAGFSNTAEVSDLSRVYQFADSRKGELLLGQGNLYCLRDIQYQQFAFQDEAVAAGYPTPDGSCGCGLAGIGCFAISSQSDMKEGAWAFIESYLALEEEEPYLSVGFPTRRSVMDRLVEEELKERSPEESGLREEIGKDEYVPKLDEFGRPYPFGTVAIMYEGDFYNYRYATRTEVDQVLALIDAAKPFPIGTKQLLGIIEEEAEAFYQGQKSVDEVADIIQRRVEIYVSENM